jgi:hypothetical protein
MKSPSTTFFTGTATSIASASPNSSDVTFDVELFWRGPMPPESKVVPRGVEPQKYPTFDVLYESLGTGDNIVAGRRYHVIAKNESANPCSVFDAKDHPHLTDGIEPVDAYGDFVSRAPPAPSGPVDNTEAKADWWAKSIRVAVLLGVLTALAVVVARQRRGSRHPGLGAIIGLDVGAALTWWEVLLPELLRDGEFYEIEDPLLALGFPLLVVGTAVGAIVGALLPRSAPGRSGRTVAVVLTSVVGCLIAAWVYAWFTGIVNPL